RRRGVTRRHLRARRQDPACPCPLAKRRNLPVTRGRRVTGGRGGVGKRTCPSRVRRAYRRPIDTYREKPAVFCVERHPTGAWSGLQKRKALIEVSPQEIRTLDIADTLIFTVTRATQCANVCGVIELSCPRAVQKLPGHPPTRR